MPENIQRIIVSERPQVTIFAEGLFPYMNSWANAFVNMLAADFSSHFSLSRFNLAGFRFLDSGSRSNCSALAVTLCLRPSLIISI